MYALPGTFSSSLVAEKPSKAFSNALTVLSRSATDARHSSSFAPIGGQSSTPFGLGTSSLFSSARALIDGDSLENLNHVRSMPWPAPESRLYLIIEKFHFIHGYPIGNPFIKIKICMHVSHARTLTFNSNNTQNPRN